MNDTKLIKARYFDYIKSSLDELDEQFTDLLEEKWNVEEKILIEHMASEIGSISETIEDLLSTKYAEEYYVIRDEFYTLLAGLTHVVHKDNSSHYESVIREGHFPRKE